MKSGLSRFVAYQSESISVSAKLLRKYKQSLKKEEARRQIGQKGRNLLNEHTEKLKDNTRNRVPSKF